MKLLTKLKNKINPVLVLMIMTAFYFSRSSIFVLVKYFNLSTFIAGGITLVMFFALLLFYSFKQKNNISVDGILLVAAMALLFVVTLWIHPEYEDRIFDVYFEGRFSFGKVFFIRCRDILLLSNKVIRK